jgi:polyphosphate kinase
MDRNFFRRVEVMFPVLDAQLRGRLLADLDIYLSDNSQAWELRADGSYRANRPAPGERPVSAQAVLLAQYSESS